MSIVILAKDWDADQWAALMRAQEPSREVFPNFAAARRERVRYALVWKPDPGLLTKFPGLEVIFNLGAGVDAILADETIPKAIPIVRVVDPNLTGRMVEWVTLSVLFHHRQMPMYQAQQRQRLWRDTASQPAASAVTVGILGFGELGQASAKILKMLGFPVIGWSRGGRPVEGFECFAGAGGLTGFLSRTDILVCLLPLTPATRGLLNRDLFAKLKRGGPLGGPVLINAGRGPEQVEADILAALDDGTLIGASLDVFETEPLPSSSPLWSHPKVVVTPHVGADSEPALLSRYVLEQIGRHERGQPLQNVVDRARGY